MDWDKQFIRFYQRLESEQRAWHRLTPLTRKLFALVETQPPGSEDLKTNSQATWDFHTLHALGFSTVHNPHSTGALTIRLYRNERGQYFIRSSGGCIAFFDDLFGPFEHDAKDFIWQEALAKPAPAPTPPPIIPSQAYGALLVAIAQNRLTDVNQITQDHPDVVNEVNDQAMSPLIYAAALNQDAIASVLLDKQADPRQADSRGFTALMYAVLNKNHNLVRRLLTYQPDLAQKNNSGYSIDDYVQQLDWEAEFEQLKKAR